MDTSLSLISRVIAGGQTGVDRGALQAAIACKVVHGGWCPAGGWAEDKPYPPGVLIDFPGLKPTIEAEPAVRTRLNIRDSHATIALGPVAGSEGCAIALAFAEGTGRPVLMDPQSPDQAREWLESIGRELIVNFVGPRESQAPGIRDYAYDFVVGLLS